MTRHDHRPHRHQEQIDEPGFYLIDVDHYVIGGRYAGPEEAAVMERLFEELYSGPFYQLHIAEEDL